MRLPEDFFEHFIYSFKTNSFILTKVTPAQHDKDVILANGNVFANINCNCLLISASKVD